MIVDVQPDGTKVTMYPDGTTEVARPDGTVVRSYPDGRQQVMRADGVTIEIMPDGTKNVIMAPATEEDPPSDEGRPCVPGDCTCSPFWPNRRRAAVDRPAGRAASGARDCGRSSRIH